MKKKKIAAYAFTLFLSFNLVGCNSGGADDHQQNEMQEGNTEPTARREADSRGVEPGTNREPVSPGGDPATLRHTDPDIGGHNVMSTQSISENVTSEPKLSTFASLIRHAEVVGMLSEPGPFTVFVPSNDAFEALPDNTLENLMKPENRQQLREMVNSHIVSGAVTVNDLRDGTTLRTAGGNQLSVSKQGNRVAVNGAEVVGANLTSQNGVIHVVSEVLATRQ